MITGAPQTARVYSWPCVTSCATRSRTACAWTMSRLVTSLPEKAQEEEEQVDEIEVERERADNRVGPGLTAGHRERHRLEPVRVKGREAGEHDDADEGDEELQRIVL